MKTLSVLALLALTSSSAALVVEPRQTPVTLRCTSTGLSVVCRSSCLCTVGGGSTPTGCVPPCQGQCTCI
ncbi:hypothetical protein B0T14DRAFT_528888 [Immersiella caudata]|uniref:Uncharacterized protein n=1 Tax=Immersiella caudata TaxID=314043 RepID=A0AA39WFY1_9PEZI|nr:hypothetical protein B0T14DRAFT_528888 [Immersiella caudata]